LIETVAGVVRYGSTAVAILVVDDPIRNAEGLLGAGGRPQRSQHHED
jgi:hypothetical protein